MKATGLLGCLMVAGFLVVAGGCSETDVDSQAAALMAPSATVSAGVWMPSVSEIETAVKLTPEQRGEMEAALKELQAAAGPAMVGPRGHGRGHGPGACVEGEGRMPDREPPLHGFLERSARILEPGQFAKLTELLAERREAHRAQMAERRGRGERGPRAGSREGRTPWFETMADELALTDEQRAELEPLFEAHHEAARALREEARSRGADRAQVREQVRALRDEFHAQIETILTAEQLEQMEQQRTERRAETRERHEGRAELRMEHMLGFLTRILDLDAAQVAQIQEIAQSTRDQVQAIHEQVRSEEISLEDVRNRVEDLHENTAQAIRDVLTEDQIVTFDALQNLVPAHAGGPGMEFGHGFRGKR